MSKREKLSIALNPEIKKQILTYAKVNGTRSISYHIEQAVKMYLHQDDQILAKQIENLMKILRIRKFIRINLQREEMNSIIIWKRGYNIMLLVIEKIFRGKLYTELDSNVTRYIIK